MVTWFKNLKAGIKVAIIAGMFTILAAIIAGIFSIIAAIIDNRDTVYIQFVPTDTPVATVTKESTTTPTFTPIPPTVTATPTPYARIAAFSIKKDGKVIQLLKPRESATVKTGWSLQIKAEVETNTSPKDFVFKWYTCQKGEGIVIWGAGVIEMPYEALNVSGSDCIRVMVWIGDVFLNEGVIFLKIE